MEPTEGLIATPAVMTARRAAAWEGERSDNSLFSISRGDQWRWAPMGLVM